MFELFLNNLNKNISNHPHPPSAPNGVRQPLPSRAPYTLGLNLNILILQLKFIYKYE
jgi:hypothetical protein